MSKLKETIKEGDEIECNIPQDNEESLMRKIKTLRESVRKKVNLDYNRRYETLKKLLELWDKYRPEVEKSNYLDLGMTENVSFSTCYVVVRGEIVHAINHLYQWVQPRKQDSIFMLGLAKSYVKPEPLGLALIFSAWNCNFLTLIVPIVQAIAAGNCILAKPASTSPNTAKVCLKIINELPHDIIQGLSLPSDLYTKLFAEKYDLFVFTGSAAKGKTVNCNVAPFLTNTILELGGQNPVIVDKTADLKQTALSIIFGRHMFSGQACISPEYIMADKDIMDKLIDELLKAYDDMFTKEPEKSDELGRIVNQNYAKRLKGLIENPGNGAKMLYGDKSKLNVEKRLITPFLFKFNNLDEMGKSELAKAEIFGPVLYIAPYNNIEEAINYMLDREKPLASYLFTNDQKIKDYVREHTTAGCLDINDCIYHFATPFLPFGGVGNSGISSYHGKWGFDNMSHLKPVLDQSSINFRMRYPPFSKSVIKLTETFKNLLFTGRCELVNKVLPFIVILIIAILIYSKFLKK